MGWHTYVQLHYNETRGDRGPTIAMYCALLADHWNATDTVQHVMVSSERIQRNNTNWMHNCHWTALADSEPNASTAIQLSSSVATMSVPSHTWFSMQCSLHIMKCVRVGQGCNTVATLHPCVCVWIVCSIKIMEAWLLTVGMCYPPTQAR